MELTKRDTYYMECALQEAQKAYDAGEIPVGAVVVCGEQIIASSHNVVQKSQDATAHAELRALQAACRAKHSKYLQDCTLFVTLEPCPMCAMASFWTLLRGLVFGTSDMKRGYRTFHDGLIHPKTMVQGGLCAARSRGLLEKFFKQMRAQKSLYKRWAFSHQT